MLYSFATAQAEEIYSEVSQARAAKVEAIFIAGGPHPSAMPEEVLEHFDFVVIGEGEETLPESDRGNRRGPGSGAGLGHRLQTQRRYPVHGKEASGGSGLLSALRQDPGAHRDLSRLPLGLRLLPDAAPFRHLHAPQIDPGHRPICPPPQGYSLHIPQFPGLWLRWQKAAAGEGRGAAQGSG